MNNDEAAKVLRAYNGWRVDDPAYPDMPHPVEITQALGVAIDALSAKPEPVAWKYGSEATRWHNAATTKPEPKTVAAWGIAYAYAALPPAQSGHAIVQAEGEAMQALTHRVEKMLCEKLGREWAASGISIESLIDDLANRPPAQSGEVEALERAALYLSQGDVTGAKSIINRALLAAQEKTP